MTAFVFFVGGEELAGKGGSGPLLGLAEAPKEAITQEAAVTSEASMPPQSAKGMTPGPVRVPLVTKLYQLSDRPPNKAGRLPPEGCPCLSRMLRGGGTASD